MFKEITTQSLKELFVHQIEETILSGELKPGDKLPPERELADTMKINRSVVSSGLQELTNMGFLEMRPRKGTYVIDYKKYGNIETLGAIIRYSKGVYNSKLMNSIIELWTIHDGSAAQLAAINREQAHIDEMLECINNMENAEDVQEKAEQYFEFHRTLSLASGNVVYPLIMQEFREIYINLFKSMHKGGYLIHKTEELRKLTNIVEQKDSIAAHEHMIKIIKLRTEAINKSVINY